MAASTMPKISSLLDKISADFSDLKFAKDDTFYWSPKSQTIFHPNIDALEDILFLLHEIGHARLNHLEYSRDIELIDMEREAWKYACQKLAPKYGIPLSMDDDLVEDSLDSYRQWLNSRSTCPTCHAIGLEQAKQTYACLVCKGHWTVNEARTCGLKRYKK